MDKTANYNLPQWVGTDPIRMKPFNDAFDGIDLALKANADAAQALQSGKADAQTVSALAKNLGAAGHNARIAWGSYTGTGTTGAASPNTLQFDFYPVLVLVAPVKPSGSTQNPSIFLRGRDKASSQPEGGNDYQLTAAWTDNALSWYSTDTYAGYQHNFKGNVYCYAVLGYDKVKEEA